MVGSPPVGSLRGRGPAEATPNKARPFRARGGGWAGAVLLAGVVGACSRSAEFVHPEFPRFHVQRIGLFNVENTTVYDLRAVRFGGIFQHMLLGVREYDVHALLDGAIEEALLLKNYETLSLGPAPPDRFASLDGTETLPPIEGPAVDISPPSAEERHGIHDAELYSTIVFWSADTGARPELELRFRVELYSAADSVKLYAGTFRAVYREGPRTRTQPSLEKIIRPAVRRAFADLPPAEASGDDGSRYYR